MEYSEIRSFLEKNGQGKFKFERWIVEPEIEIISKVFNGFGVCYESGTANGLSAYCFSKVCETVHTYDPYNRPKIWDFISDLDHSRIQYNEMSFDVGVYETLIEDKVYDPRAFFIDGDHSYRGCKEDWDAIQPFLTSKDVVVFHDALGTTGVRRLLDELDKTGTVNSSLISDSPRRGIMLVKLK
jgi:hypothetical protein